MESNNFIHSDDENKQLSLDLHYIYDQESFSKLHDGEELSVSELPKTRNSNEMIVSGGLQRGVKRKFEQCQENENYEVAPSEEISKYKNISNHKGVEDKKENDDRANNSSGSSKLSTSDYKPISVSLSEKNNSPAEFQTSTYSPSSRSTSCRKVYGLRPRSGHRKTWIDETVEEQTSLNPINTDPNKEIGGRIDSTDSNAEDKELKPRLWSKGKSKNSRSKPLSKYRRITANARERDRMKEINTAFTALRGVLPTYTNAQINNMTKYSTLQLAVSYIKGLSDLLNETNNAVNESVKGESCSEESADTSNRDVNLSVGISEIKCGSVASTDCEQKPSDFLMFSKSSNFNFTHENIQGLEDFENLPEMRWAFDLMMD